MRNLTIKCHCGNGMPPNIIEAGRPEQRIVTGCALCVAVGCQSPDCGPTISWEILTPPLWICSVCRRGEHDFHTVTRSRCEIFADDPSHSPCACRVIRLEHKPLTPGLADFRSTYAPATPVVGIGPRGLVYRTPFGVQYENGDMATTFSSSGVFDMQDGKVVRPFLASPDELRDYDNVVRVFTRGSSGHPRMHEIAHLLMRLTKLVGSTVD